MGLSANADSVRSNRRWELAALSLLLLACLWLAWTRRFIQDDAFISLRYSRNLARGLGLVFNPDERVEGYTNFLWTVWLSVPFRLDIDPVLFSFASGMAAFAGVLLLAVRLTRLLLPASSAAPFLVLALLGANHTFSSFATGGLETMLQTLCALAALEVLVGGGLRPGRVATASILAALAVLTRPDSPLLLLPCLIVGAGRLRSLDARERAAVSIAAILPAALLIGGWVIWKVGFYGSLLPNTLYVKTERISCLQGLVYTGSFAIRYLLVFLVPLAVSDWVRRVRESSATTRAVWMGIGTGTVAWLGYVIALGGDFMEYRYLVPVLPWTVVLVTAGLLRLRTVARAVMIMALVVAGFLSPLWPAFPGAPVPLRDLAGLTSDWQRTGRALSKLAGAEPPVVIGVTAAGAVPFYSDLESVDLLGLNDAWIAHHGIPIPSRYGFLGSAPGHALIATPEYLDRRGVHLLLNHPWLTPDRRPEGQVCTRAEIAGWPYYSVSWRGHAFPRHARLLEIPVDAGTNLLVLQLRAHPAADSAVASGRWRAFPIRDERMPQDRE